MVRNPISLIPLGVAVAILVGCDQQPSDRQSGSGSSVSLIPAASDMNGLDEYCGQTVLAEQITIATTDSGDFTVELISFPVSPPTNQIFSFDLRVTTANEIDAESLDVLVDAGMPQHAHGMNVRPRARVNRQDASEAVFTIDGMMFHMPGVWELSVDVVDGPYTERVSFDVLAQ